MAAYEIGMLKIGEVAKMYEIKIKKLLKMPLNLRFLKFRGLKLYKRDLLYLSYILPKV
ncbi:hypothetical protein J7K55_06910 [Candidatus Aerophobetes bacterium]|nr:hypothetical protein [Candidatus Aerophobetes bacterium]